MVQWPRLGAPNAGSPGMIPGQGTISHMLVMRAQAPRLEILCAATKTRTAKQRFLQKEVFT